MSYAAITWIGLVLFALGSYLANHGKETTTNFWSALLGTVITAIILYWGGFFS